MKEIKIFDSTLRDGAQGENISFTVEDKLNIVKALDKLGVGYIEAGNPGSNPKDLEFFARAEQLELKTTKLVAFGSTRRRDINVEDDKNVIALLTANTDVVTIFGKSWDLHVTEIIKTTLEENLNMIRDTLSFFVKKGKEVIFDAEHFFDGYKKNPEYALKSLKTAQEAGASCLVLCDTNGGCFPDEIFDIVTIVKKTVDCEVGIHCHNDMGLGVANSIMAVKAGATHVQGTYIGFGERTGNANLSSIIASLQIKMGCKCIEEENLSKLTKTARYIAEVSNLVLDNTMPYVGTSAFAHKGGMHVDGVNKNSVSFEHISPELVGNKRKVLLSEVSGRGAILKKINQIDESITKDSPQTAEIIDLLKELEYQGYQFESATASLELIVLKHLGKFKPCFELVHFRILGEKNDDADSNLSSAMVKIKVGEDFEITADEGNGPVDALNKALVKAVKKYYPTLHNTRLCDYKVRVMDPQYATSSKVRVLIETTDGDSVWTTVGVSSDIINASIKALVDSIEYKLMKENTK